MKQAALLEEQYQQGEIDLLYRNETQVSEEDYVPYGWQFRDENVCIVSAKGERVKHSRYQLSPIRY